MPVCGQKALRIALLFGALAAATVAVAVDSRPRLVVGRVVDRISGLAVTAAQVRLFDPDGVMMGLVETDATGLYRIDLGTLDNSDLEVLEQFYVEARRGPGGAVRRTIGAYALTADRQIQLEVIALP